MNTSLVITSYHIDDELVELTSQCLESLKYGRPDEVILVDDASPIMCRFTEPDIQIFRSENGGFAKCANTGWATAMGDVLILSNNDIVFTPGWLEAILKPLNDGYDISSIRVSDSDGYETEDRIEKDGFFGSLWAMKREVYEEIGGFDERFTKGCFEDKDYYLRAKAAGFEIAKNHGGLVEHRGRATMSKVYPNDEAFTESQELFKRKWGKLI